ncbi:MAG: hypothetical protein KKE73_00495 [Proteobacteria bacterium]|nr:hypothetical protein [Pseudomonadota bacterium]
MSDARFEKLARALTLGLGAMSPVDGEVLRFAEDALGLADSWQWNTVFNDPGDPHREMLVELLLFPDSGMMQTLESLLVGEHGTDAEAAALTDALIGKPACFLLPQGEALRFLLSAADARLLVRRLRLTRSTPVHVQAALEGLSEEVILVARLRLRRARFTWNARAGHFMRALIASLGLHPIFPELLDYSCLFLEAEDEGDDLAAAMVRRRQEAELHLKNHQAFQERLAKSNFETMHLAGDQAPHVEPTALVREIRALDMICPAVFGRPAVSGRMDRNLGQFAGAQGVRDLLRLLDDD